MGGDMVEVRDIRKSYGRKLVLDGVGFSAQPGEQIALVGRNGCGKSTLMQIMAGLIKADSGTVSYFGQGIRTGRGFSHTVGYLPQENPLIEELSVADNISLWSGSRVRPDDEVVKMFHLKDMLKELSTKLKKHEKFHRKNHHGCILCGSLCHQLPEPAGHDTAL